MKPFLSEKNIVVVLFIMVIVTYSFAQQDFKKMEKMQIGVSAITGSHLLAEQQTPIIKTNYWDKLKAETR